MVFSERHSAIGKKLSEIEYLNQRKKTCLGKLPKSRNYFNRLLLADWQEIIRKTQYLFKYGYLHAPLLITRVSIEQVVNTLRIDFVRSARFC
ncbi:hypothetical protein DYBT9623_04489 [Dyadobacter sp. CECT 9623]|uniref:Uncharacterized protein n=1 Tax=Dyadobacter linearis TaxID=2823330 RepID=A0ABN7RCK0_9BACT|nr:hypothetical protein DYBT9623_04489 [Dyadobacter sp. CECT 9623]